LPIEQKPELTEDEKRILHHEAFMAEVMRFREKQHCTSPKPRWLLFLESSGGTAVIAGVIGAAVVQLVSGSVQKSLKQRDFQQAWMQARGTQALAAYKEELDQEEQAVRRAYEVVGKSLQASEDLIDLTGSEFVLSKYVGSQRAEALKKKNEMRTSYDKADTEWRGKKEELSLLIALYHHGRSDVVIAWRNINTDLTDYMDCAWTWYDQSEKKNLVRSEKEIKDACADKRRKATGDLDTLTVFLQETRSKARGDWESPDKLIEKLEKANRK
jgi:hypothetical protein